MDQGSSTGNRIKNGAQWQMVLDVVRRLKVMGCTTGEVRRQLLQRLGLEVSFNRTVTLIRKAEQQLARPIPPDSVLRNRELEVLYEVRRQAYDALERSKRDYEKRLKETTTTTVGEFEQEKVREQIITEHRNADTNYMRIIIDTNRNIRELLGLDIPQPQQIDINVSGAGGEGALPRINFDLLHEPVPITDPAADRIAALEMGPQLILNGDDANGVLRPNDEG